MNLLLTLLLAVQMLTALTMIVLILLQHGKGADAGAAFGGGGAGSATLFGASGSANFMSRSTAVLATLFLASTLGLAYFANLGEEPGTGTVLEGAVLPAQQPTAAQIPGQTPVPPPAAGAAAVPPAAPGAGQIPGQ
ncbi:preprotein translocase subunit SecG [Hydrogenophaga sp.]|uniref:preprotein translocase subunit SecG n=1 Tax=Hydrogenophaga sp. TaxID=1904254 RepID=UPI0019C58BB8|nr:preprotein translocase subunit SecG [Hydrogenophaga sp.]MBD3893299.1 preprotein translocase subunit SecG [Hydrogenophaga sp.]